VTGSPLRPEERDAYATPVATRELDEPEAGRRPAGEAAGAPAWIRLALVLLALFFVLLVGSLVLAVR
jgi:hypothetical protein